MSSSTIEWLFWRPITRRIATLQEVETHWDICDVMDANEALDILDELDELESKSVKREQNDGWK